MSDHSRRPPGPPGDGPPKKPKLPTGLLPNRTNQQKRPNRPPPPASGTPRTPIRPGAPPLAGPPRPPQGNPAQSNPSFNLFSHLNPSPDRQAEGNPLSPDREIYRNQATAYSQDSYGQANRQQQNRSFKPSGSGNFVQSTPQPAPMPPANAAASTPSYVGKNYTVLHEFITSDIKLGSPGYVHLTVGSGGKVKAFNRNNPFAIQVVTRTGLNGWVPIGAIQIQVGDSPTPATITTLVSSNDVPCREIKGQLKNAFVATFRRWMVETEGFWTLMPGYAQTQLHEVIGANGHKINDFANRLCAGVEEAQILSTLNNPNFKLGDLHSANQMAHWQVLLQRRKGGIYVRVYTVGKHSWIYVGKAIDFLDRVALYQQSFFDSQTIMFNNSEHAQIARAAGPSRTFMSPLCVMDMTRQASSDEIGIGEQAFTNLLECYADFVIRPEMNDAVQYRRELNIAAKGVQPRMRLQAKAFYQSDLEARKMSKWHGAGRTRGMGFSLTQVHGLQIQSPLTEITGRRTLWLKMRSPTGNPALVNYTKAVAFPRYQKLPRLSIGIMVRQQNGKSGTLTVGFPTALRDQPAPGDSVFLTVEMNTNLEEHPNSYANLCTLGIHRDWKHANCFAFRLNWKDKNGKWYEYFARATTRACPVIPTNQEFEGQNWNYARSIAIVRYFQGYVPLVRHPWDLSIHAKFASCREVFYEGSVRIWRDAPAPTLRTQKNDAKSQQEIYAEMQKAEYGLKNIGTPPPKGEKKCDTCKHAGSECDRHPTFPDRCVRCSQLYGRPCTYSGDDARYKSKLLHCQSSDNAQAKVIPATELPFIVSEVIDQAPAKDEDEGAGDEVDEDEGAGDEVDDFNDIAAYGL